MAQLAESAHLVHLESLNVGGNRIGAVGVESLMSSKYIGNLRELDFMNA